MPLTDNLINKKVLISGQARMARTETLEEYLKDKVSTLGVIAFAGAFQRENVSKCRIYQNGKLVSEFKYPAVLIERYKGLNRLLLFPVFAFYLYAVARFFFRIRKQFDIFIGISHFSGIIGIILKKLCLVKRAVYYCIDYYPDPGGFSYDSITVKIQNFIDRLAVRHSDFVWNISPKIPEARTGAKKYLKGQDKQIITPLCISARFMHQKPFEEVERWTIGFIGALSRHQGLDLLFRALPKISQALPEVKVRIIGRGPFESHLREMASSLNVGSRVDFCGYLEEEEMKKALSSCALGVAPWATKKDNYFFYSDPGKIKLYAFCGLPIIMTKGPAVADEIEKAGVGLSINYDVDELAGSIIRLLGDERLLREYKDNTRLFAKRYTSENVFAPAMEKTLNSFADR